MPPIVASRIFLPSASKARLAGSRIAPRFQDLAITFGSGMNFSIDPRNAQQRYCLKHLDKPNFLLERYEELVTNYEATILKMGLS